MKTLRPLFLFVALLLVIGMACSFGAGGGNTPAPAQPQQEEPQAPPPQPEETEEPEPVTEEPVATPEPVSQQYFTEEFDQDPQWSYFLTTDSDEDKISVEFDNSLMTFDFEETYIFAYYLYEQFEYGDVRIDMRAENRGKNNNNISLVCRATTEGWYEFSTEGGGLWYLYAVTINDENKAVYNRIDNGGAQSLKQGKEVNEFGMVCEGNEITLIVNGKELKTVEDKEYSFDDGGVGFNISSLNVTPITVEVDWFKISEP